jgi:predicted transcriptional regulator YdeE
MQENLAAQIPDKTDSSILAVYTDYASDQDGEYTFVIGARAAGAVLHLRGLLLKLHLS